VRRLEVQVHGLAPHGGRVGVVEGTVTQKEEKTGCILDSVHCILGPAQPQILRPAGGRWPLAERP
jgi:hypothetical protein